MQDLTELVESYLSHCLTHKCLNTKTVRAYRADLTDYVNFLNNENGNYIDKKEIEHYIDKLHMSRAPRTVKRRIASLHAFYKYLEYKEYIEENPLIKLDLSFKLPQRLPRYIPNHTLQTFYQELYRQKELAGTDYQLHCAVRSIAVIELLFSTGLRISELCDLGIYDVNLDEPDIIIHGKGDKERILHLTEAVTINALQEYKSLFYQKMVACGFFL